MARETLRPGARAGLVICGLCLVGVAVLLGLKTDNDMTSLAALLGGVLLILAAGAGRLPAEIGLQRVAFGESDPAPPDYRKELYDAVRAALPEASAPERAPDWQPEQPIYWVQDLRLRIVVSWTPDESLQVDATVLEPLGKHGGEDSGVLMITNADETEELETALRAVLGERAAVIRWRSPADNEALRRSAHQLRAARTTEVRRLLKSRLARHKLPQLRRTPPRRSSGGQGNRRSNDPDRPGRVL
jgi:hypothetical protein